MKTIGEQIRERKDLGFWKRTPKYLAIKDIIEEAILELDAGDKIPPVRDLKKKFKVSQRTLDHALRELEAENLISRRWGSGIYVNKKDAKQKTGAVGVVVSNITNRFCALLIRGIERRLSEGNHRMILCNGYEGVRKELGVVHSLKGKIDGLIINPTTPNIHNSEYVRYFGNLGKSKEIPFLLVDIPIPGITADFIGFDNFKAFREVTRNILAEKSARRIVYLGSLESHVGVARLNGFKEGLREANIDEEKVKVIHVDLSSLEINIPWRWLSKKELSIFFVASPNILPKLINHIQKKQLKVPEEALVISVVEEDYKDYITLPIIALVKPSTKLGEAAATILSNTISEKPVKEITRLDLEIEVPCSLKPVLQEG